MRLGKVHSKTNSSPAGVATTEPKFRDTVIPKKPKHLEESK